MPNITEPVELHLTDLSDEISSTPLIPDIGTEPITFLITHQVTVLVPGASGVIYTKVSGGPIHETVGNDNVTESYTTEAPKGEAAVQTVNQTATHTFSLRIDAGGQLNYSVLFGDLVNPGNTLRYALDIVACPILGSATGGGVSGSGDVLDLIIPDPSVTPGPEYAVQISDDLETIKHHGHTGDGDGHKITTAALDIDDDLSLDGNALEDARFYNMLTGTPASTEALSLSQFNGDLFWTNASGQQVKVTDGNSVNLSITGSFTDLVNEVVALSASLTAVSASLVDLEEDFDDLVTALATPSHASIFWTGDEDFNSTANWQGVTGSVNQMDDGGDMLDFSVTTGSLVYTGAQPKDFLINAVGSVLATNTQALGSRIIGACISKNNDIRTKLVTLETGRDHGMVRCGPITSGTSHPPQPLALSRWIRLQQNDSVQVLVQSYNTGDFRVERLSLSAWQK